MALTLLDRIQLVYKTHLREVFRKVFREVFREAAILEVSSMVWE